MKRLLLAIALVLTCAAMKAQTKTTYNYRDAQARAGDAVSEVCVKPTVVEVELVNGKDTKRISDKWTLSKADVIDGMKGNADNVRAWATYLSSVKNDCDIIMAATYKIETVGDDLFEVTVVGYPGRFVNWHPATNEDFSWIWQQKQLGLGIKGDVTAVNPGVREVRVK